MSEGGVLSSLKNRVSYNVSQMVDDPAANAHAAEVAEKEKNERKKALQQSPAVRDILKQREERVEVYKKALASQKKTEDEINQAVTTRNKTLTGALNDLTEEKAVIQRIKEDIDEINDAIDDASGGNGSVRAGRIWKKILLYGEKILTALIYPLIALIVASFVANEMIMFPAGMRAGMFLFVLIAALMIRPVALALVAFYLCKKGYSYYVNEIMDASPKRRIMPHLFAILPISTYQYEGISSFFMYPFTYPKSDEDESVLPEIMKDYYKTLEQSFGYLKKVANLPAFVEGVKTVKANLQKLHEKKYPPAAPVEQPTAPVLTAEEVARASLPETPSVLPSTLQPTVPTAPTAPTAPPAFNERQNTSPPAFENESTAKEVPSVEEAKEEPKEEEPKAEEPKAEEPKEEEPKEEESKAEEPKEEEPNAEEEAAPPLPPVIPSQKDEDKEEEASKASESSTPK